MTKTTREIEELKMLKNAVKNAVLAGRKYYSADLDADDKNGYLSDFHSALNIVRMLSEEVGYFMNNCTYLFTSTFENNYHASMSMVYGIIRQATFVDLTEVD